ncbi:MAG: hypothetical protein C4344_01085 [Acidimicrobiia bacterium]
MTTLAEAIATLTAPGGPFEVRREPVCGNELLVYVNRLRSMRELVAMADARGDAEWVVQQTVRLTYAEHNARVRALAHNLLELGLAPGDRVALVSANNPAWIEVFWACAVAGLICVPLNAWWKSEELAFALDDSGARVLIADQRRYEVVAGVLGDLPELAHTFVIGTESFAELEQGQDPGVLPDVSIDEDDISGIFYTSGTTGRPKGATITHRQVIANLQNVLCLGVAQAMTGQTPPELAEGERPRAAALLVVPLFHTTGCHATMVLNYAAGAKLVLMPPGRFDPEVAMRLIEQERITAIGGVPTIMWRIVEHPRLGDYDLSSVTRISYGGAGGADRLAGGLPGLPGPVRALRRWTGPVAGGPDRRDLPQCPHRARDGLRAHGVRVGRDGDQWGRLPRAPGICRQAGADRGDPHRRRRRQRRPTGGGGRDLVARSHDLLSRLLAPA